MQNVHWHGAAFNHSAYAHITDKKNIPKFFQYFMERYTLDLHNWNAREPSYYTVSLPMLRLMTMQPMMSGTIFVLYLHFIHNCVCFLYFSIFKRQDLGVLHNYIPFSIWNRHTHLPLVSYVCNIAFELCNVQSLTISSFLIGAASSHWIDVCVYFVYIDFFSTLLFSLYLPFI